MLSNKSVSIDELLKCAKPFDRQRISLSWRLQFAAHAWFRNDAKRKTNAPMNFRHDILHDVSFGDEMIWMRKEC